MTSPQRQPASRLEALLRARQFVITAEITPPVSCNADDLLRKAQPLAGLADAVNVTDGASARAHLSAPIAAALLARAGIEPILQFTCRDRNRIALQADLMGAAACGVRPELPPWLGGLMTMPEQVTVMKNDEAEVERFVLSVSRAAKQGVAG